MAKILKDQVEHVLKRVVIPVTLMVAPLASGCVAYGPVPGGSMYAMNGRYYQNYRTPFRRYYYPTPASQPPVTPYMLHPIQPIPGTPAELPASRPPEPAPPSLPPELPSARGRELVDAAGAAITVDGAKHAVERVTAAEGGAVVTAVEAVEAERAVEAGRLAAMVRGVVLGGEIVGGFSLIEAAAAGLLIYGIIEYFSSGADGSPEIQYDYERFG